MISTCYLYIFLFQFFKCTVSVLKSYFILSRSIVMGLKFLQDIILLSTFMDLSVNVIMSSFLDKKRFIYNYESLLLL